MYVAIKCIFTTFYTTLKKKLLSLADVYCYVNVMLLTECIYIQQTNHSIFFKGEGR